MKIRELQKDDIPALADLATKTWAETFAPDKSLEELSKIPAYVARSEESLLQSLAEGNVFIGAEIEQGIIGYTGLRNAPPDYEIIDFTKPLCADDRAFNGIYVRKDYQGKGIGRKLIQAALEHPYFQSAENIYLSVWDENKPAYHLYQSFGFKPIGRRPYYEDNKIVGYDLVLMRPSKFTEQ